MKYNIQLIDIDKIKPIEGFDEQHVLEVLEWLKCGVWTVPIIVEKHVFTIMDGHNRFEAAKRKGLKRIPCWLACYYNDVERVYSLRDEFKNDGSDDFIRRGLTGNLYPLSTAKHIFKISKPGEEYKISLYYLQ